MDRSTSPIGPLQPTALEPVVAAAAVATRDADSARHTEATARAQIEPAATLDTAITAGRAQLAALDGLHSALADGKFARYLTERRTRALLGVASELFARLSDGQFRLRGRLPDRQPPIPSTKPAPTPPP